VVLIAALMVPMAGVAQANHPAGSCLDLSPETDSNPLNTSHVLTATLRIAAGATCGAAQTAIDPDQGAVTIHFERTGVNDGDGNTLASPEMTCTIQPNATNCTVSYIGTTAGADTIRAWVDEADGVGDADEQEGQAEATAPGRIGEADTTDVVTKTWAAPVTASRLDCAPETANVAAGGSHTVGCTATDSNGDPMNGARIDVEATGANDPDGANTPASPDFTCTTGTNGSCTFTHSTGTGGSGTTTYRAWIDLDNSNTTTEADLTEGNDGGASPGGTPEPDTTDVVTATWTSGPAVSLDCDDSTGPDTEIEALPGTGSGDPTSSEVYTCVVRDAGGNPATGAFTVLGEVETAVNDPDNPDSNTPASPDYQCTTVNGTCQITVTQAENELGTTTICFFIGDGGTLCAAETTNENQVANGSDTGNDFADQVELTWSSVTTASRLDCAPETDSNPIGTSHTITCTARNSSDAVINGALIDVEATGTNDPDAGNSPTSPDFTCTTAGSGTCNIVDSTGNTTSGLTTYRAWIDRDGSNATVEADATEARDEAATPGAKVETDDTDVVTKSWTGAPTSVTIAPTSDTAGIGACNPFTILVSDAGAQPVPDVLVDVEQVHQLATDNVANNEPTVSFCTPTVGTNPSAITAGTGDRVENPDNLGTAGGETAVRTNASGLVTIGVAVAPANGASGAGNVAVTAFVETTDDDDPSGTTQVTATKTWVVPTARTISCAPATGSTATGLNYNVTCTVRDQFNQTISGVPVVFSSSGPGTLTAPTTVNTNQFGQATVTATSLDPGVQTITGTLQMDLLGAEPGEVDECDKAANNPAGSSAGVCASSVTHTWTQAAVASAVLSPNEVTTRVGGESTFTFQVRDANNVPVAGVPVSWSLAGVGRFVSMDAETDANGIARAVLTSDRPGNTGLGAGAPGCDVQCVDGSSQHWGPSNCSIFGTNGGDTLRGTRGPDTICGFGGNDRIIGRSGNDVVFGGGGNDTLKGGEGLDSLKGGGGNDDIFGGSGGDLLYGGSGNDLLNGNDGTDGCRPGSGRDIERNCEGSIVGRQRT
jgi:protocatechuate 3,4-dioxygenase beta subunit